MPSALWRFGLYPKQGLNRVRLRLPTSLPKAEAYRPTRTAPKRQSGFLSTLPKTTGNSRARV